MPGGRPVPYSCAAATYKAWLSLSTSGLGGFVRDSTGRVPLGRRLPAWPHKTIGVHQSSSGGGEFEPLMQCRIDR